MTLRSPAHSGPAYTTLLLDSTAGHDDVIARMTHRELLRAGKRRTLVDTSFTREGRALSRLGNPARTRGPKPRRSVGLLPYIAGVDLEDRSPALAKRAFVCPMCDAYASQNWASLQYVGGRASSIATAQCSACLGRSYWSEHGGGQMVWPGKLGGPPPSGDMPENVKALHNEARSIMNLSPRAASALLRFALETLLTDLYPDAGNLNATIGAAAAAGLPDTIIQAMDVLRFNGNAAIHEISREDTPETATALSSILNLVVERLITEPRQIAEMHAQLPTGVLAQIERRDGDC